MFVGHLRNANDVWRALAGSRFVPSAVGGDPEMKARISRFLQRVNSSSSSDQQKAWNRLQASFEMAMRIAAASQDLDEEERNSKRTKRKGKAEHEARVNELQRLLQNLEVQVPGSEVEALTIIKASETLVKFDAEVDVLRETLGPIASIRELLARVEQLLNQDQDSLITATIRLEAALRSTSSFRFLRFEEEALAQLAIRETKLLIQGESGVLSFDVRTSSWGQAVARVCRFVSANSSFPPAQVLPLFALETVPPPTAVYSSYSASARRLRLEVDVSASPSEVSAAYIAARAELFEGKRVQFQRASPRTLALAVFRREIMSLGFHPDNDMTWSDRATAKELLNAWNAGPGAKLDQMLPASFAKNGLQRRPVHTFKTPSALRQALARAHAHLWRGVPV
ncbi:MAG TPA: hypothetical protein VK934_03305 [Fimbriimonas sp.]|nr:hypothetical protein [Fimbriimonas sp.]